MGYDPKKYSIDKLMGKEVEDEIVTIREGSFDDLFDDKERMHKYLGNNGNKNDQAIEVETQMGVKVLMPLPKGDKISLASLFGRFISKYHAAPSLHMKIRSVMNDQSGFYEIKGLERSPKKAD